MAKTLKKYATVQLGGWQLGCLRIGGAGLGNILFPWARAKIFSKENDATFLPPPWASLKIGPWLRNESDKRNYGALLRTPISSCLRRSLVELTSLTLSEMNDSRPAAPQTKDVLYTFSGMRNKMHDIFGHHVFIRQELTNIYKGNPPLVKAEHPYIAVHVRQGDFRQATNEAEIRDGKTNTQIPDKWYASIIGRLHEANPSLPVHIYSDGNEGSLREILSLPNTKLISGGNALTDMFGLADSLILVASNSTFSQWGSYLGQPHTCWFPGTLRERCVDNSQIFEGEIDYEDELPPLIINTLKSA